MISNTSREYASHYCSGYQTQLGNTHSLTRVNAHGDSNHNEKPGEVVVVTQPTKIYIDDDIDSSTVGADCRRAVQLAPGTKIFQLQDPTMDAMTIFAHPYGDVLSQHWSVEYVGSFLTARDLVRLCSTCGVLGNIRGVYVRAALKAQHGYVQQPNSCLGTLTHLKYLESIPRVCTIDDLDLIANSCMTQVPLRRGHYILLVYSWTYRFHTILDLFLNSIRITSDTTCHWHYPFADIYSCRFPNIVIETSGLQCLICLTRPCDTDASAEIIEHRRVRLARICLIPA